MTPTRIEHQYPEALEFLCRHGPEALVVLHDLLSHAERRKDCLVVQASVRQIAERLPFLSKDTVHRRLRDLSRARIIQPVITADASCFSPRTYVPDLSGTGIGLATTSPPSS